MVSLSETGARSLRSLGVFERFTTLREVSSVSRGRRDTATTAFGYDLCTLATIRPPLAREKRNRGKRATLLAFPYEWKNTHEKVEYKESVTDPEN